MSTTSQLSAGAAGPSPWAPTSPFIASATARCSCPAPASGDPADRDEAIAVLRHTVELGINLIDTADAYGPFVTDELIRAALHPYPDELVIATKVGFTRQGPDKWAPVGRPEYLRQQTELNLRNLKVDRLDLLQLHRIDTAVALEDQVGVLKALQDEGKVRHIGLSEVSVDEMKAARKVADIVSVQNQFNFSNRSAEPLLDYCETEGIGFIPWTPLATGDLAAREPACRDGTRTQPFAEPTRTGLAAQAFPGNASHPRHLQHQTS